MTKVYGAGRFKKQYEEFEFYQVVVTKRCKYVDVRLLSVSFELLLSSVLCQNNISYWITQLNSDNYQVKINKCVAVQTVVIQLTHCYQLGTLAVRRKYNRFNTSQVPQLFCNLSKISQLQSSSWTQCQNFDFDSIKEDLDFIYILIYNYSMSQQDNLIIIFKISHQTNPKQI
ncbi:Hypothetical_protein [Hexamita inflata]|uniref:Hypothetical_protein n=1 Tax=Hexamita inflata TaxID=28002 RepID=A0AA86NJA8_9EUKA|nr:Hypothetical protein HINF_LOCUS8008 [Hexamita inflata]